MSVEAVETNLTINDVPESEVWDIGEFEKNGYHNPIGFRQWVVHHYKVRLINNGGQAEVIDFDEWREKHKFGQ